MESIAEAIRAELSPLRRAFADAEGRSVNLKARFDELEAGLEEIRQGSEAITRRLEDVLSRLPVKSDQ